MIRSFDLLSWLLAGLFRQLAPRGLVNLGVASLQKIRCIDREVELARREAVRKRR